ncbi:hypothetical protein [Duganella sp. Root1480D1]|uniref:hypothetical protein n=1 Tax=Duganella sp. Root1480D1 TaxID=1736471 RepID=UPI00070A14A8|nr:hypothetical protein [Duganella sp. Root1480D1]KQZ43168.1 hypothetical protein ASD58_23160 [Duganella sp. Root1480D1]
MEVEFWGLLHDGGIDAICGEIPGAVSIEVSIRYLRQQFPGKGTGFRIDLVNCSQLTYREYDSTPITDFNGIVALGPEIVSVEQDASPVVVNCVMGSLAIAYESASIHLDTGEEISSNELFAASKAYWDAWSASQPAAIDEKNQ